MANKVLVINSGSSSLKFKLFSRANGALCTTPVVSGIVERIGEASKSRLTAAAHGVRGPTRQDTVQVVPRKIHPSGRGRLFGFQSGPHAAVLFPISAR